LRRGLPGVYASSIGNHGGVFETTANPQISLTPINAPQNLPSDGQAGDVLAISHNPGTGNKFTELWFCDRGRDNTAGACSGRG
jgi:hypothetical protein